VNFSLTRRSSTSNRSLQLEVQAQATLLVAGSNEGQNDVGRTTNERHFKNFPFLFQVKDPIVLWSLHTGT
jgi:hypothetical protein